MTTCLCDCKPGALSLNYSVNEPTCFADFEIKTFIFHQEMLSGDRDYWKVPAVTIGVPNTNLYMILPRTGVDLPPHDGVWIDSEGGEHIYYLPEVVVS